MIKHIDHLIQDPKPIGDDSKKRIDANRTRTSGFLNEINEFACRQRSCKINREHGHNKKIGHL